MPYNRFDTPFFSDTQVVKHKLEQFLIGIRKRIPDETLAELDKVPQLRNTLQATVDWDYLMRGMVVGLTGWILRDEHKQKVLKILTVEFRMPSTWWQMFKEQYFPPWLLTRWPVKMKKIEKTEEFSFEQEIRVCPHSDVVWEDPAHIDFLMFNSNPPRESGVLCPTCGKGRDTDGDGNCQYCGPIKRFMME